MTHETDILVAGAGATGLATALALARGGASVELVGSPPTPAAARTVALFPGSVALLETVGVWPTLQGRTSPLATMRMIDATGSLFRPPPVEFHAAEIGAAAFAENVANDDLVAALTTAVEAEARIQRWATPAAWSVEAAAVTARCTSGDVITAPIAVAADGRDSALRLAAGVRTRRVSTAQVAITARLAHSVPHDNVSTEFHTRSGPFTLVPLPARPDAPNVSSLVWVMSERDARDRMALTDAAFADAAEHQSASLLGTMRVLGPRGRFPLESVRASHLARGRVALVGDAAHALPPIGAQGLNLGLGDVASLAECLAARTDLGPAALARYASHRSGDVAVRSFAVEALNRSLIVPWAAVDFLRGSALLALAGIGPLRRSVMRAGMGGRAAPFASRS